MARGQSKQIIGMVSFYVSSQLILQCFSAQKQVETWREASLVQGRRHGTDRHGELNYNMSLRTFSDSKVKIVYVVDGANIKLPLKELFYYRD